MLLFLLMFIFPGHPLLLLFVGTQSIIRVFDACLVIRHCGTILFKRPLQCSKLGMHLMVCVYPKSSLACLLMDCIRCVSAITSQSPVNFLTMSMTNGKAHLLLIRMATNLIVSLNVAFSFDWGSSTLFSCRILIRIHRLWNIKSQDCSPARIRRIALHHLSRCGQDPMNWRRVGLQPAIWIDPQDLPTWDIQWCIMGEEGSAYPTTATTDSTE